MGWGEGWDGCATLQQVISVAEEGVHISGLEVGSGDGGWGEEGHLLFLPGCQGLLRGHCLTGGDHWCRLHWGFGGLGLGLWLHLALTGGCLLLLLLLALPRSLSTTLIL